MKPLNFDNSPCSPISSNCVIWQGPNLDCIKLCTGDTVSDVVASLATELCTVMDQLNISNYDLTCFDLVGCKPATFDAFLQFLIEQVCNLNNIVGGQSSNNPNQTKEDTLVTVAPCFVVNGITVMSLTNYVIAIGKRVCDLLDLIGNLQVQIDIIDNRVTVLEEAIPPSFLLPSIPTNCFATTLGVSSATIDLVLNALINDPLLSYCTLLGSTGTPAELDAAVLAQCIENGSPSLAYPPDDMQTAYPDTWITDPDTAADTINNLWVALCDVYTSLLAGLTVQDTSSINLTYDSTSHVLSAAIQDTGWVNLEGFEFYAGNSALVYQPKCRRIGNVVHFRGIIMIPLANGSSALPWNYGTGDTYASSIITTPFTGLGGVDIDAGGSVTFNSNGTIGRSVVPLSIMAAGENFDFIVQSNYVVASRNILLDSDDSALLTNVVKIWITTDKRLVLQYLIDNEYSAGGKAANITGTSVLNTLVSRVNAGDQVPQFARAGSEIAGNNAAGLNSLTVTNYAGTIQFPFTCDAGDPTQCGGFGWLSLDGMMAYIAPCTTDIPVSVICP